MFETIQEYITGELFNGVIPEWKGSNPAGKLFSFGDEKSIKEALQQLHELIIQESNEKYKSTYYWLGLQPVVTTANPDFAKDILYHPEIYSRKPTNGIVELLGNNLFSETYNKETRSDKTLENRYNIYHRHIVEALRNYLPIIEHRSQYQLERYKNQTEFDLRKFCAEYGLIVLLTTVFGFKNKEEDLYQLIESLSPVLKSIMTEVMSYPNVFKWMTPGFFRTLAYIGKNTSKEAYKTRVRNAIKTILKTELEKPLPDDTKQRTFIDDLKKSISANIDEVAGEISAFLFAGFDSTANTLAWLLLYLAKNTEIQKALIKEIMAASEKISNCKTSEERYEIIRNLPLLKYIIKETLRLRPPFLVDVRGVEEDIELGDLKLKKGYIINVFVDSMHKNPSVWGKNVLNFDPWRFTKERFTQEQEKYYLPFGSGPQRCTAKNFAEAELNLIIYEIFSKGSIELSPSIDPDLDLFEIALDEGIPKPKYPVPLVYKKHTFTPESNDNFVAESENGKEEAIETAFGM